MSIAEKLTTIAENEQKVYEAGKESMIDRNKVIEKTVSGNPVYIDDASEIPHTVGVKVTNLDGTPAVGVKVTRGGEDVIPYPYYEIANGYGASYTRSGITVTSERGKIVFNGTATGEMTYRLLSGSNIPVSGSYTLSGCKGGNVSTYYLQPFIDGKSQAINVDGVTTYDDWQGNLTQLIIYVKTGTSLNNLTINPVLTKSSSIETTTTDSNGYVEMHSLAPNMTLTCDEDVDIEVNFWKSYGMQTEYDRFWNNFRYERDANHASLPIIARTNYEYAFSHWGLAEYIEPPYQIQPTSRSICMFNGCTSLKEIRKQYFDLSQCDSKTTGSTYGSYYTFGNCLNLELIEDVGLKVGYYYCTFWNCTRLKTIEILRSNVDCVFASAFYQCKSLETIPIEGEIGQNFDIHYSPLLTTASLLSILTALSKDSAYASGKTATFNTASQAVIEADSACSEQLALAVSAGWTIAYA